MTKFYLPGKVPSYLRRLENEYKREGAELLFSILGSGKVFIIEETHFDNWNGGTYGHDVKIFLSEETLASIGIREDKELCETIREDLAICAEVVENEWVHAVVFELEDEDDEEFQKAISISGKRQADPNKLDIWKAGCVRLFTIEPMLRWQKQILKGLETMEVMLAFVTNNFHSSVWTNQEIGFALGRNIPIISLKLEKDDPLGFIGDFQAEKGNLEKVALSAAPVYKLISKHLTNGERLKYALIESFTSSRNFIEAKERFDRMALAIDNLIASDAEKIIKGFHENDQLHGCYHLSHHNRMVNFLEKLTGNKFERDGKKLKQLL